MRQVKPIRKFDAATVKGLTAILTSRRLKAFLPMHLHKLKKWSLNEVKFIHASWVFHKIEANVDEKDRSKNLSYGLKGTADRLT